MFWWRENCSIISMIIKSISWWCIYFNFHLQIYFPVIVSRMIWWKRQRTNKWLTNYMRKHCVSWSLNKSKLDSWMDNKRPGNKHQLYGKLQQNVHWFSWFLFIFFILHCLFFINVLFVCCLPCWQNYIIKINNIHLLFDQKFLFKSTNLQLIKNL